MWVLLDWGFDDPSTYGWVSFGVFILYVNLVLLIVYIFSADRGKRERDFIRMKYEENKVKKSKRNEELNLNYELVKKYQLKIYTNGGHKSNVKAI